MLANEIAKNSAVIFNDKVIASVENELLIIMTGIALETVRVIQVVK